MLSYNLGKIGHWLFSLKSHQGISRLLVSYWSLMSYIDMEGDSKLGKSHLIPSAQLWWQFRLKNVLNIDTELNRGCTSLLVTLYIFEI